jgi:hypothetical protein
MQRYKIELKWAAIFTVMTLVWMCLERLAGLHDERIALHPYLTNLFAIPAIAVYVLALREKRERDFGGAMTYTQGFMTGAVVTLFVTLVTPLTQYITSTVITPHFFENAIRYSVENGKLTQAAAEEMFNLKSYLIQASIGAPVMGILTSAIVAIFTRRQSAT